MSDPTVAAIAGLNAVILKQHKEIQRLTAEISRLRQHCHKISAEMCDKAATDRIKVLEDAFEKGYREGVEMFCIDLPDEDYLAMEIREAIAAADKEDE